MFVRMALSHWDSAVGDCRRGTDSWGFQPHPEQVCRAYDGPLPGTDGIKGFVSVWYNSWQIDNCKGIRTWCFTPLLFNTTDCRLVWHLVFVRWLRCITLVIAGEHLLAFGRSERRLRGTKWPHPVYIFITALLTYLLTSGKNLQVNLLGSFSKE